MKILHLDHTSCVSGAEISLLDFLGKLDKQKYSSLLVCPPEGPLVEKAQDIETKVQTVNLPNLTFSANPLRLLLAPLEIAYAAYRLKSIIADHDIDLVHANSIRAAILGTAAAGLAGVPVIWHVRDFLPHNLRGKIIRRLSGIRAERIVAISQAIKDDFAVLPSQKEKTLVIYDGIDLDRYNPSLAAAVKSKTELGLTSAFPIVGIFGQIIDWKGQKEFIEAAGRIAKSLPEARFLVVGEALFRKDRTVPYKRELFDLAARLGIAEKVVFTGFREDIPDLMAACDILVLASWEEPLGMVQLEAMALEKTVIATDSGGAKEVVKNGITGMLVPPQDPEAIALSVLELIDNKEQLRKMGREGRKQIEQNFNLELHAQKVEQLYEEIAACRKA